MEKTQFWKIFFLLSFDSVSRKNEIIVLKKKIWTAEVGQNNLKLYHTKNQLQFFFILIGSVSCNDQIIVSEENNLNSAFQTIIGTTV